MLVIGITGGIGSGKSLITDIMKNEHGARIIDTDTVAHELMEPGMPSYNGIVKAFGGDILDENKSIDREKLGGIVFGDKEKLKLLDDITHPAVRDEVEKRIEIYRAEGAPYTLVETALLIEAGYSEFCDRVWYVHADREIRFKRLYESRGMDKEKAVSIMEKQQKEDAFIKISDDVIENSTTKGEVKKQIEKILDKYVCLRGKMKTGRKIVNFT